MHLTSFSDYTLRTLMYLALRPDTLCTIDEIAVAYGISINHLSKVVHQSAQAGDIQTLRGQGGGLRLARRPETINIGAVLRRTELDREIAPCFGAGTACVHPASLRTAGCVERCVRSVPRGAGSHDARGPDSSEASVVPIAAIGSDSLRC